MWDVNRKDLRVMSSGVCKRAEGVIFPVLVEAMEDGEDDAFHAGQVDEADHRSSSPSDFDEASFDDVGGAELASQRQGEGEERQQVRQILFERSDDLWIAP